MKIGIEAADRLTTVSPRYAEEIRGSEEFSGDLRGAIDFRADRLTGILNGDCHPGPELKEKLDELMRE